MKNGIKRENFALKDLKLLKGGGIESTTIIEMNIDGSYMEIKRKQETPVVPHPDLENLVRGLKENLLISCRFKGLPKKELDILKEKTTVTAVHVSGQEQNEGVIISGKIQAENGSNIAINSPRMRFSSSVYGFEEQLQGEIAVIQSELFKYLHEDKKAQLEAFGEEDQGPVNEKKVIKEETDIDAVNEKKAKDK